MHLLSTPINFPASDHKLDHSSPILLMGSCFSDYMGVRLRRLKFNAVHNPFGVLYNPASIASSIKFLLQTNEPDFLIEKYNELWFSFSHHTSFSSTSKKQLKEKIRQSWQQAQTQLKGAKFLFLTFGTAFVYYLKQSGQLVANCHKLPSAQFKRKMLGTAEIVDVMKKMILSLQSANPDLNIVFTVSPIRHLKDGAIENMRSKSSLILAIKELEKEFKNTSYFPSYEFFMDELRDYRFYADDMLHPAPKAVDMLWDKFIASYCSISAAQLIKKIDSIAKSIEHRAMHPDTEAYSNFLDQIEGKITALLHDHPSINFSDELSIIASRRKALTKN